MDPSTFFPGIQNTMIIVQTAVLISDFIGHLVRILTRPVYQRDFNWNEQKVSNFLLTIMTSGYVQPLLLYKYNTGDEKIEGKESEMIDGQHRALSIQAFVTGNPIINNKGKPIMAYLEYEGHYLFYKELETDNDDNNPIKKWAKETKNIATYLTEEQRIKFDDYELRLETCKSRLTLERRRLLFDSLQEGVPVRNSDKDKNNVRSAVVNELNTDYPTWEDDYKANYMPLLTSCAVKNVLYCVVRLYAISVDPKKADNLWTDKEIKNKIADNKFLPIGKASEFKAKMDQVYETMRQLKARALGAKYTPIQLFALCLGVFNGKPNLVDRCAFYITSGKGKKKYNNTSVVRNKCHETWWFEDRYKDVKDDVMAYYQETRSFLESSAPLPPPPPPAPEPPSGPRKWGACTPKNVWRRYFGESEEGNCSFDFCNKALTRKGKWERGHDIPHSKGGSSSDMSNLYVVCKDCNRKQGTQTRAEFERSQMPV